MRQVRPPRAHPGEQLEDVDSFSLAAELVRRGAVQKSAAGGPGARITLPVLEPDGPRPTTRGECPEERPCPWVRCRAHLWRIDSDDRAGHRSPDHSVAPAIVQITSAWSCVFDVIEAEPAGLLPEAIGAEVMACTGRRIAQLEQRAMGTLNDELRALHGVPVEMHERNERAQDRVKANRRAADNTMGSLRFTREELDALDKHGNPPDLITKRRQAKALGVLRRRPTIRAVAHEAVAPADDGQGSETCAVAQAAGPQPTPVLRSQIDK